MSAIIKSRIEIEKHLTNLILEKLVLCLREHEETTKEDIISCLSLYLRSLTVDESKEENTLGFNSFNKLNNNLENYEENNSNMQFGLVRQKSIALSIIPNIIDPLLENVKKILTNNNNKILLGGLNILTSLSSSAAKEIILNLDLLKENINNILSKNSSNFNLLLFGFFNRVLKAAHNEESIIPHLDTFIKWMIQGLKNDFYKVNIESSNMASELLRIMKECLSDDDIIPKLNLINTEIIPKFTSNDLDQELKITLISTVGKIICYSMNCLDINTLNKFFEIFLNKFKNENLVVICTNWIIEILKCEGKPQILNNIIKNFIPTIIELINKKNVVLRHKGVEFLCSIIEFYPISVSGFEKNIILNLLEYSFEESFIQIIFETISLLLKNFNLEKDLILLTIKESIKIIDNKSISLTQKASESLIRYNASASARLNSNELESLIKSLLNFKEIPQCKSKIIAYYSSHANNSKNLVKSLISDINSQNGTEIKKNILLIIGDIALISSDNSAIPEIFNLISNILKGKNDDIKANAALALAKVGLKDTNEFVKIVKFLNENIDDVSIRYSFSSIKEFIHLICDEEYSRLLKNNNYENYLDDLFGILFSRVNLNDENILKLCGECLGLLSGKSKKIQEKYMNYLDDKNDLIRAGFFYGLKSFNLIKDDNFLKIIFEKLITGLSDSSNLVKEMAYNSLISFSHDYPKIFKIKYSEIWSCFENDYIIKPELINEVDMGGVIKIKIDKGLPIRKAVFSTLKILLDNIPEKINFEKALGMLLKGLGISLIIYFLVFILL